MTAGQSRYRMRRHARRLRRYGLEPIAIVNPGDLLPETCTVGCSSGATSIERRIDILKALGTLMAGTVAKG
jgi:hypothetical protein